MCRYALFYHSYLQKSGRSCRYIPKNFQVCTLIRIGTLIWKCGRLQLSVESCGDFSPVNKTLPNLPTNSKKPWNYNGTIIFEIEIISKFTYLQLNQNVTSFLMPVQSLVFYSMLADKLFVTYSRVQKSIENFVFRPKMAIFWRAGIREQGLPLLLAFQYLILMI